MAGLDDLKGLFQQKGFNDSMIKVVPQPVIARFAPAGASERPRECAGARAGGEDVLSPTPREGHNERGGGIVPRGQGSSSCGEQTFF